MNNLQNIARLCVGEFAANCFVIDLGGGRAAAIDPGSEAEVITAYLEDKRLKLTDILLTHGHFDHTGAVQLLKERYGAKVYIGSDDECMLCDKQKSGAYLAPFIPFTPTSADVILSDGQKLSLGDISLEVLSTSGHTAGSVCYVGEGVIFTGDTVFKGSVGRTDLFSGSATAQRQSIERLKSLKTDYTLYCGHGDKSSLENEIKYNPYF